MAIRRRGSETGEFVVHDRCGRLHVVSAGSRFAGKAVAMPEPDNLILPILREMRGDIADLRSEMRSLRADVASDIHGLDAKVDATRHDLSDQIVGLRRAVVEYHSTVIGHGP